MELVWPILIVGAWWIDVPVVLAWIATGVLAACAILELRAMLSTHLRLKDILWGI